MGFDFQTYLQTELTERCRANPAYSLRAFARDLDVEPSALSKILNGKRALTEEMRSRFGKRLKLSREQITALACADSAAADAGGAAGVGRADYRRLAEDSFTVLANWYHYAILELTKIDGFESNSAWIARKLGLTRAEASEAIARLKRLGFLEEEANGRLHDVSGNVTTVGHEFTNVAFKNMQRQVLQQALAALETDYNQRDQSSMTMAIDSSKLPQAKQMLKKFRRDLSKFLESGPCRDDVYQLSLSLFPLTKRSSR